VPLSQTSDASGGEKGSDDFLTHLLQDLPKYGMAQIALLMNGLLLVPALTHTFSPGVYGDFVICSSVISVGILSGPGWLQQAILRFYPVYEKSGTGHLFLNWAAGMSLRMGLFIAGPAAFLLWRMKSLVRPDLRSLLWLSLAVMVLFGFFSTISTFLRSMRKMKAYAWSQSVYEFSQLILGLGAVFLVQRKISSFFWAWMVSALVVDLWLWFRLDLRLPAVARPHPPKGLSTRELMSYGYPLVVTQLLTQLLLFADRYVLDFFRGPRAVGLYSLGFLVGQLPLGLILTLVMSASYPLIMRSWEQQTEERTVENIRLILRYYVLLGVPSCVGLWALARPIIRLFASPEYAFAARTVPWVAAAFFLSGLAQFALVNAHLKKRTVLHATVAGLALVVNVALNLVLIPRYDFYGAAIALFLAFVFYNLMAWWLGMRLLRLSLPWGSFGRTLGSVVVMGAFLWLLLNWANYRFWFSLVPVGVVIYFLALYGLGEFSDHEKQTLINLALRRRG
jgi:O-antigen/teichoic acid export membrane protein